MKIFDKKDLENILKGYRAHSYVVDKAKNEEGVDSRIVSHVDKGSYIAEQYKALRTNLYSLAVDKPIKTMVITSAQPLEGKSVTCCNLGVTLSLDVEKKVLLVDADLRRPMIHQMLGIKKSPGFCEILSGESDINKFTERPAIGNLFIIPSGFAKGSPSELLGSTKIKNIINTLREKFDYIIFDTPPVLNVTDATILGSICDAVILVVKAEVTNKNMVEEAFNMLAGAQAKPRAAIITNMYLLADSSTYYYRYKYYRKENDSKET
ncbi:MAG: CpsD/CapB family tyrosine-protein kinase [Candidatus Omnitrophota bacterium]|jgi:capsular exopolysaccharide synthesis family protein